MRKLSLSFIVFAIFYLISNSPASAGGSCQPIYGGGQICPPPGNILINKKVLDPSSNVFVDNLGINNTKFQPEQVVQFRISVTNTGNEAISGITLKDIFPQFLKPIITKGTISNDNTIAIQIQNLNPNETQNFDIAGQVFPSDRLPNDRGIICVVNQAIATFDGKQTSDNTELCIQKPVITEIPVTKGGLKVFPQPKVVKTPPTGPEMLPLMALLPSGALGFFLRRKASK